ncbi:hypothetical protein SZ64_17835 [Erythrobacter sp. SG61-1L]|uniref:hypothetical protein n=1 Tax=Erythrobacter sp. SG61-1L TaxID=1603897 RepID=UPI0006C92A16|nr:hypothetical protein [Erythrobacter sp. SG61-1L]KPL69751.1 hypothetical protein SZ64_17610 [Erythrobacter sp. SG61-1L]KPL69796.1 hypothetical protein SZ64_17835 [Erythrobacter sp. SG61-1L]
MLDAGTLALMIPILGMSIPIIAIWTKHQQKIAEMQANSMAGASAERAAQYAGQIRDLEERVRVLERIVTDNGYDIASQIEALRDTHKVELPASNREKERI